MAEVELQQIGPYLISGRLSIGSTNTTSIFYKGKQRRKEVIIQRLSAPLDGPDVREAFLLRAKQLKKLKGRNTVAVLDANFDGDYGYLVLESRAGQSMLQRVAPGQLLSSDEVRRILSFISEELYYAHLRGIMHSNLQPESILMSERNEALLTNFSLNLPGLALDDEPSLLPYMAPEHLRGEPTPASDQYSLAIMAYEWLCGQRPYAATERAALLQQQEQLPLRPLRDFNESISPAIENVILKALSLDPEARYYHMHEFAQHYLNALMGLPLRIVERPPKLDPLPVLSPPPPTPQPVIHNGEAQEETTSPLVLPQLSVPSTPRLVVLREKPVEEIRRPTATPLPPVQKESDKQPDAPPKRSKLVSVLTDENGSSLDVISPAEARLVATVTDDLRQGGVLSESLPGYEERLAQIEMASLVSRSLMRNTPAIVEATTGTGKGLAYLLPVVRSGKVAIVSTANKALQEQLYYKDIPFVQKHIQEFGAALVKGVSNYVCLDRMEDERVGMQFYAKNREFQRLVNIVNDPEASFNGDFETLGFSLPADVRSRVATDSDQCAWNKCGFFADCYVRQMRERAELAQIIVVNHTLLLLDAAMDGFLLPERDVIILDEAHHLEEEATRSFTITINPAQIQLLLAQRLLKDHSKLSLQDDTLKAATTVWARLEQTAIPAYKGRANLEEPLEEGLHLASKLADLADSLRRQKPKDMPEKEGQLYEKLIKRTQNMADNVRTVFAVDDKHKWVYFVERVDTSGSRGGFQLQVSAAPLDVTSWLKERLFDKCNVICTSATLATIGPNPLKPEEKGPNFTYFRRRVGLDPLERPDILENVLPLTFDYESNALLYLPRDLPEPTFGAGQDDYMLAVAREMYRLVKLSRGRAFLLFSSKRMLERAYELMSPHLSLPLLKQGDMTRLELTRRFRTEEGAVLFGLKSFWEGVDIAGEALSMVVIDKLPFDPPDDPVHEARVALMKAARENWFGTLVLPQAVLRLKQGLGRLLRTRDDRGVLAILDTRLHTKGYGKLVLNALPPAKRTSRIKDVEHFFTDV